MQRRNLLKIIAASVLSFSFWRYVTNKKAAKTITGQLTMPNFALGHRLRDGTLPEVSEEIELPILIIGGGIAGLSACRALAQKGQHDFLLLELEATLGGNSAFAKNQYSSYPLGAHYLPIPNGHDQVLLDFLAEIGVVKGYNDKKLAIYDEFSLCFAPQERLFLHGHWQEDLVPNYGVPAEDAAQIKRFLTEVNLLKKAKGNDGFFAFDIPSNKSSKDTQYIDLQQITFSDWLQKSAYHSQYLLWYLDYCCRDDYGAGIEKVSAWAGLHYHAARKGLGANAPTDSVLTWSNGNGFLMEHLAAYAKNKNKTQQLVFDISPTEDAVFVKVFDAQQEKTIRYKAAKVILATPQFINDRLLKTKDLSSKNYEYYPWIVATITLADFNTDFAWDNVIYGSKGLGYIYAQHQTIGQTPTQKVISYYRPLDMEKTANLSRKAAFSKDYEYFKSLVISDLKEAHYQIDNYISTLDIHLWGHAMICPTPAYFAHPTPTKLHPRIALAHSDLSGFSIFEEAFHSGIQAVEEIL